MTIKEKQKLQKKEKVKKRFIKVINIFCYVMTFIFILTLLLSLFSSNNKDDDNKLNVDENGNIQLVNRQLANNNDYYIIGGDIAYQLNNNFAYKQQLIDDIVNKNLSLYWFYNVQTNNARWVTRIARASNDTQIFVYHNVYDSDNDSYVQSFLLISIDDLFSNEGLIMFDSRVNYNEIFKNVFKGMYRLFNFDKTLKTLSNDYYNMSINFGLNGIFNLNSTYNDKTYTFGGILHYNTPEGVLSSPFSSFSITYDSGIIFNTDNGIFSLYTPFVYDDYKVFKLNNTDNQNLIYISNMVLTNQNITSFNGLFIDTSIKTTYSYKLSDLFLPQRKSVSSEDSEYTFSFDYTSNYTQFDTFEVSYNINTNPFYFEYDVYFRSVMNNYNRHVLDTLGEVVVNGTIGHGSAIKYNTSIFLSEYNSFIIYDYYSADIQTFMVTQVYTGEYFTGNSGDVGTAFDLVITAITSLLPFLSFYIFPNITIASLLLVPLVFSLVLFIFKLFKR